MTETPKEAKRWAPKTVYAPDTVWMQAQADGGWIRYSDYEALAAERDALRDAMRDARSAWGAFKGATVSANHFAAVERLDAALTGEAKP